MRRLVPILFFMVGLVYTQPVQAEIPAIGATDTNADGKIDSAEIAKEVAKDAELSDIVSDVTNVVDATKDFKTKGADKAMVLLLLLGAIFKLLLSSIKVLGRNIAWFKTKDGKRVIKYSTLGLGALAALVSNMAFGMSWMEAGFIFLSGPVAVAIHEYTKDSKEPPIVEGSPKSG